MGGPQSTIEFAPLMSQLQRQFLDQYIRAVANSMQGMTLGQPWTGPNLSSYTPTDFNLWGNWSGWQDQPYREIPPWEDTDEYNGRKGGGDGDGSDEDGQYSIDSRSKFTPQYINPLVKLLTTPLINPFRYSMTGNYPKKEQG